MLTYFCLCMVVELGQATVLMKLIIPGVGSLVNLDVELTLLALHPCQWNAL